MARPTKNEALLKSLIDTLADAVAARLASSGRAATGTHAAPKAAAGKKKRNMSPEGRARIIAAAKKRWAAYRKNNPDAKKA